MSTRSKPKVVFTYVEAGMGHIAPMTGMAKVFERKYGDKCEIVHLYPFRDSQFELVRALGRELVGQVKLNANSYFCRKMERFSYQFSSKFILKVLDIHFGKRRKKYLEEYKDLKPDLLVASYYLPAHLAYQSNLRGDWDTLIASYSPDYCTYPAWDRNCDAYLIYNNVIRDEALRKGFNENQLKMIPCILREGIAEITKTKQELKKEFGLDNGKLTVVYSNGAYGSGKTKRCLKKLIKSQLDMNLVVLCGKNQKIYDYLNGLSKQTLGKVNVTALGFTKLAGEYMKAGDVCIGKGSPSSVHESLYLGTPFICNAAVNGVEESSAKFFIQENLAVKTFSPRKIIKVLKDLQEDKTCLQYTVDNFAKKYKDDTGAEKAADVLYELLKTRFPEL